MPFWMPCGDATWSTRRQIEMKSQWWCIRWVELRCTAAAEVVELTFSFLCSLSSLGVCFVFSPQFTTVVFVLRARIFLIGQNTDVVAMLKFSKMLFLYCLPAYCSRWNYWIQIVFIGGHEIFFFIVSRVALILLESVRCTQQ